VAKIFLVMVNDRHVEPTAFPFDNAEAAISAAREYAKDDRDDFVEEDIPDWLYCATDEGADWSIWVVEAEVNRPIQL
jgi:hypothetical protein